MSWVVLFFARVGVETSFDGIVVRNWVRQHHIKWSDIRGFDFGEKVAGLSLRESLSSPVLQTYVVLKNGKHCVMSGLSATRVNRTESKRRVQEMLDELDDERRRYLN
jgi:hypothetical protein